jgi:DNA polymerase III subunit delta'
MRLSEIVGHGPLIALLRQAVARESVPQSLLFAGPEGVGKRTTAVALAQAINCPARRASRLDDACGTCPTCQRIARGQHSDVVEIDRGDDSIIKLKLLRERVLDSVGYRPFEAVRRVFVIAADDLREDSQDALLKTLEEPPPSAILILVSAYPGTLLETVQSRCRRLRFGPLNERDVAKVLVDRAGVDRSVASGLAAASGGSVSRALAEKDGDLGDDREAALGILAAATRSVGDQLKASAALAKHGSDRRDREALGARIDVLRALLRDLGVLATHGSATLDNADLERDLRALSGGYGIARVARGYAALAQAESALDRNASPKIVADWVALHL